MLDAILAATAIGGWWYAFIQRKHRSRVESALIWEHSRGRLAPYKVERTDG